MIVIYFSESSLSEYLVFFQRVIQKFRYEQLPHNVRDILEDGETNDIIVTGEPGDTLFGMLKYWLL